jgi:transmembrane sensor
MLNADPSKSLDKLLVEQSSALFETMKGGDEKVRRTLVEWLLQSRRHVRTHLFMAALDEELRHIDPQRRIPIPQVRMNEVSSTAISAPASPSQTSPRTSRRWAFAAAAGVMLLLAALMYQLTPFELGGWRQYATAVGEQRAISLADGSIVQLNTRSRVKVRVSETSRDIRLLEGEALFKVREDSSRPFNVFTSDATIVAVGTQFNVYRLAGRTRVSVLEGRVRVSAGQESPHFVQAPATPAPLLSAGEEAEIRRDGRIDRRETPDVIHTAAWTQRRVVFRQEPLAEVIREFNRYRKTPQFRVEHEALATRRYSGIFDVDDPNSLEDVLAEEEDVILERIGNTIVIRGRTRN